MDWGEVGSYDIKKSDSLCSNIHSDNIKVICYTGLKIEFLLLWFIKQGYF